ncbi:SLAP domain-containing protein [Companilactobacillus versmoldensis]|uniref:S-layer protein C-terminal domain-containing protein n=1 Tax=Companilactobacillus versmoldensis DSM 14857 = KCTC 3814 TaxID=1423815 RepID=A0A0R1SMW6_9LACO|nr:SLAP domain-containing protein [Companilactobacillus versmoldensis]KRL67523.1 hypothetical protein FC27_GL001839 [Companilactobacillus versmoldensis DSM 14857 = KCTC 3814]
MKNTRSYIFKSLIFSGIVLGTVGLNSTIVNAATNAGVDAATKTTDTAKVVNHIVFTCDDVEIGTSATTVTGDKVGQVVDITKLIPSGYQAVDGNNNLTLTENGTSQQVKLTKASDVTANVHYIYNSGVIGTETLSGLAGSTVGVKNVPEGYYLANKNQANVILGSGTSDVYLNVNKDISNTISFVTDDEAKTEVGKATVYGEKAGDSVTVNSSQLPNGYNFKDSKSATFELQPDGSRQLVTVVPAANKETLKGTVGTFDKVTPLYNEDGTEVSGRALGATSDWATDTKMTLDGETYYRVSTSEWVKASDVYVYTPNEDTITTKSGAISHLYDANGKQLETRSVAADSAWYTDRTTTINGQKYYRVSTSEWLSAADLK